MMSTLLTFVVIANMTVCGGVKTGQLLGLQSNGTAGNNIDGLFEIDIDLGDATLLEPLGTSPSEGAIAVGPDGTLYAAFSSDIDHLVILDPETGDVTDVGPFGFSDVSGLAFAPDGTLYGYDDLSCLLLTVDVETGEATAVGSIDFALGGGLSFSSDGTLFAVGWILFGDPTLWTINLETGAATEVGPLGYGPFGDAIGTSLALSFVAERLYANATTIKKGLGGLYELDPETGEASFIGHYGEVGSESMSGMAFLPGAGDVDRDGDVDLDDFAIFQSCFTGVLDTREPLPVACVFLDADDDNDLDLTDFADFQSAFTGPNEDNE